MVRRRGGRKRALGTRAPMVVPQRVNERRSPDFVADRFIDGCRMRILVVREHLAHDVAARDIVDTPWCREASGGVQP
jgi:putative transposase